MLMRIITLSKINTLYLFFCLALLFSKPYVWAQCPVVANTTQTFCDVEAPTVANLAATPNGNGVAWYATAVSTTALSPTLGLADGEDYFADDVSGTCGARVRVVVAVYGKPFAQSFQGPCVDDPSEATIADLTATGNNIQWYDSMTGGSPLPPTTILIDNAFYYASQTNPFTNCETSRRAVQVTVGVVPVPSGDAIQRFCNIPGSPPTLNSLVVSGVNNWYATASSAVALSLNTPLVNGQSYYATTVDPPCESSVRFEVTVVLVKPNDAGTNGVRRICISDVPATPPFDLFSLLGGTPDETGVWTGPAATSNGFRGTLNPSSFAISGSPYVFTYTVSSAFCATSTSTVTITILPLPVASVAANTTICSGGSATVTFTGTPNATVTYTVNGGANQNILLNGSGTAALTNTYTTTTTYQLISVASAGTPSCSQTLSGNIVINVLPLPVVSISGSTTICPGSGATVTFTGTPNATVTYTVNGGASQTIVLNASGTATITGTYSATTTFTLVSIASSGTPVCSQPQTGTAVITVRPLPTVAISGSSSVCPNGFGTVTFTGTPNATITYTVNGGPNQTIVLNASGTASITGTYTATTTYTLVSAASAGNPVCTQPQTGTLTITVLPLPTATIASGTTICSGANATVTFTGTPNATITYTINGGAAQTILLNASGTATLTNAYTATAVFNLLSAASAGTPSCSQALTGTITITVVPLPVASIAANASVCPNGSATVTFTGTPNATVTYTVNGGSSQTIVLNASGTATITGNYSVTTVYTLTSVATSGTPSCSRPQTGTVTITVIPLPVVAISGTASICPNSPATITFTGTPNATITYTINGGSNQTIVLNGSGTATLTNTYNATTLITLVSAASQGTPVCSQPQTGTVTITVLPLPTATIASNATICIGASATVTFTGTPNATVTYTVNGGSNQTIVLNGSGTATINNTYNTTTTYTLTGIASSGTPSCSQPLTGSVTITVVPPPTASITGNVTICSGENATIVFTGTPNATVTYTINGGAAQTILLNASGTATVTGAYSATTVYTLVSVTTAGSPGCTQSQTGTITVTVIPVPVATIAANATICAGESSTITFTGPANGTITYTVNGGSNQTILLNASGTATVNGTYTTTTVYTLVSVSTSGIPSCIRPQTGSVTITVLPLPVVTITANAVVCSGGSATVTFTGTPNATVTYTVNGGNNQTILLNNTGSAVITGTYTATTVYTLVSVATTGTPGCSQPQTGTVTITVLPLPVVAIAANATICSGSEATVTFTGTPNATVTYTINGGSNQTIVLNSSGTATLTNTYTATTVYTLVSVASAGLPSCSQPQTGTITITVNPIPVVAISASQTICLGENATITFTGTPNATVTYSVDGGNNQTIVLNGSGTATITNAYTATAVYTLISVASSGTPSCSQAQSGTVTITVLPLPQVTIGSDASICSGESATITFTGTPNATVIYTINGGSNQSILLDATGTATLTNTYTTSTIISLVSVSTQGTPSCVQLQTGTVTITVIPPPVVTITSTTTTICSGSSATVVFTGTPNATVTYTIDGGNEQTIVLDTAGTASLTNTYTATTTFVLVNAVLPGTPTCSQPQTQLLTITVVTPPTVTIAADATICSGDNASIVFTGTPNATVIYTVNGGNNQTIVLDASGSATLINVLTGTTIYNLVSVTTQGSPGCSQNQTGTVTITVLPLPVATVTANATICLGDSTVVTFNGTPGATVTYSVNGGNNQAILLDASGTAIINGNYVVNTTFTLIHVQTSATPNCIRLLTDTLTITVNPLPTVVISGNATICAGTNAAIVFTGTPNTTVTYTVNNGNNQFINIGPSGTVILNAAYTVTSVINLVSIAFTNAPGCSQPQTGSVTITVIQPPIAGSNAVLPLCGNSNPQDLFPLLGATAQTGGTWSPALASGTGIFNPAVDTAGTYTYTVVATPPCVNDTASATVTIVPQTNAGTDGTAPLCSNADPIDLFTFLGGTPQSGGIWSPALPSGTGVFNPGSDTAGVYTYTVIGVFPCVDDSSTVTVAITPGPDAGISGSLTLCQNSPSQDLFLSLGGTPQVGGSWSPALSGGSGIFNPAVDLPGIYTYTFSGNQPCDDDTATVSVTINPIPDAGTDGTVIFCSNYAPADLFANLGGTPQTGGTWSPALASGTGVFNPLVDLAGTYTYTVGGGLCATASATVTVTVFQSPNAGGLNATLLINSCVTSTAVDLFTGLNGTQGTGVWNDDDNTGALNSNIFNASAVGAGTYHFTYTVSGGISPCLTDTATVTVIVSPIPDAGTFSGNQDVCTSEGTFDLFTLLNGNQPGGIWSSNTVTIDPIVDISNFTPGIYTYTYTITNSCGTDTETVQLTVLPNPVLNLPNISVSSPICQGDNAVVSFSNMADGDYNLTFDLSVSNILTGASVNVIIAGGTGSFTINGADIPNTGITTITFLNIASASTSCATVIADVSANFIITPIANLVNSNLSIANICLGSDAVVSIANATGLPDGNYQFGFSIPQGTPVTGTTGTISITNGTGQFTIPASYFNTSGNFTVTVNSITNLGSGCGNAAETATAVFQVLPIPNLTGASLQSGTACVNFSNEIFITGANNLPDGNYTIDYQLSGSSTATASVQVTITAGNGSFVIPAIDLATAGNVTVTIAQIIAATGQCGNSGTGFSPLTFTVSQLGTPVVKEKGNEFCGTDQPTIASLSANIDSTETVVWYDAAIGGNAYSNSDLLVDGNTYYAALTAASGCESATRLAVTVDLTKCLDIVIPDGFSPNNDGINDAFVIKNLRENSPNFKLEIYNRYGNIVYTGTINTPDWTGTTTESGIKVGDSLLPVGVYFYILERNDGVHKPIQGRVYLNR